MKLSNKTNWNHLKTMTEKEIDYSDIPETDLEFWNDSEVVSIHKKVQMEIEIDEDIALWLNQFGEKSNKAINNLLRSYFISAKQLQTDDEF